MCLILLNGYNSHVPLINVRQYSKANYPILKGLVPRRWDEDDGLTIAHIFQPQCPAATF